jgi:hypothetical protein
MNQGRTQEDLEASAEACTWSAAGLIITLVIALVCHSCSAGEGNLRIKSERVEGVKTINGWGTGVTHGEYIVTAAHNLDGSAPMYAESNGEWVACKVLIADVDFDVAILKPAKPVTGKPINTGINGWIMPGKEDNNQHSTKYGEWPIKICGSKTFEMPVAYGQLHGVSGAGLFLDGRCLGILSMQCRDTETGRVHCTYCPLFVVEYMISKLGK